MTEFSRGFPLDPTDSKLKAGAKNTFLNAHVAKAHRSSRAADFIFSVHGQCVVCECVCVSHVRMMCVP